ncbi:MULTISPECIES: KTSC domain-containing protein [Acetobacter]|uniref:KTSC domain-containing protein n=1 Tax=Acetobacter tropicalis TaxID=104102 RepID=A0A291PGF3_9PROT|nr:KTSC domain-containing protein [Acetobacter tropicalis]
MLFPDSEFLKSADYDPETKTLIIKMRSGPRYRYNNVPQFIFDGLLKAQSKGRFFDTFIRDKFPTSRY